MEMNYRDPIRKLKETRKEFENYLEATERLIEVLEANSK